ncbi:MAG TPA: MFS transporter [Thermoleophilaceae bacterium]|nr:MFS transporter [Thermoleophilaceae bacterium]
MVDGRGRTVLLFTCCLALFISTLDNTVANIALPSIQRSLHGNLQALQWVVDAYVLVRSSLLLSAGALADRFGRRRLFQLGLLGFGAGSVLCSLAPSSGLLIAFRVLQAIGGAALTPASLALIANAFPGRVERARALGFWSATAGASTALGPIVGGLLVETAGWRSVFWINVPVVALAYVLAGRYVQKSRAVRPRRLDLAGQTLAFATLGLVTFALIEGPAAGWGSAPIVSLFGLSAAALLAFLAVEQRRREPLLDLSAFRNPVFAGASALALIAYLAVGGFIFLNTLYLQQVRGYSPLIAGLLLAPATVGMLVVAPLSGRLTGRFGARPPTAVASMLLVAGLLVLSAAGASAKVGVLVVGYVLLGSAIGLANPPITVAAIFGMPAERAAVAGAVSSTSRQVGNALGVALLGSIAYSALPAAATNGPLHAVGDSFATGMGHAYLVAAALALAGFFVALLAMDDRPARAAAAASELP